MDKIFAKSALETLRFLSVQWRGKFVENIGTSRIELDNEVGKGVISSYDVSSELSCFTYDVVFYKEIRYEKNESIMDPTYFLYCLEGYWYHKFSGDSEVKKISQLQNVVLKSGKHSNNIIILPANVKLKLSIILILNHQIKEKTLLTRPLLLPSLQFIQKLVGNQERFRSFGSINLQAVRYAEILIENKALDFISKLKVEAAIINLLKSQIEIFSEDRKGEKEELPISKSEMDKVISMSSYIANNISNKITIPDLVKITGIAANKLQSGIQFLFGESLNHFIRNARLEYAKDLMQTTDYTISEIIFQVGFSSRGYFSKIFKERFGMLPNEFKDTINQNSTIFELSYKSSFNNINSSDIDDIVSKARLKNKKLNITGCLVTYNNTFFQILEGSKTEVLQLYESIKKDTRHKNVELLFQGVKIDRLFTDWSLALVSDKGSFAVKIDGEFKYVNMKDLIDSSVEESIAIDQLWRRVKNIIKVAS